VPLHDGIDDHGYLSLFRPIIAKVMDSYRPHAVVLQCGTKPAPHGIPHAHVTHERSLQVPTR